MILFSQLADVTKGKTISLGIDSPIEHLLLDSRKATTPTGTLFFAIAGIRHNGHDHLARLYAAGFRSFVVEVAPDLAKFKDANFLLVKSSVAALQALAKFHRSIFSYPVIGITGSNGKTIIKEWLFQILMKYETPVKNPGSYNSQIGVPLSVWQMKSHHSVGIFEAGISKPGEMERLKEIIQPTLGLFTNIGPAHDEGFKSIDQKINEKLQLFTNAEVIIYCKDHIQVDEVIQGSELPTISWGVSAGADIRIKQNGAGYDVWWKAQHVYLKVPFSDRASVENCFHTVAILLCMGYSGSQIQEGINSLKRVPMRLELKEGINHCQVIDDTYNNDLGGIEISLQFLAQQHQKRKKTVILSDVLQSGESDEVLVEEISARIQESGIHRFVGVGPALKKFRSLFKIPSTFYADTQEFLDQFNSDQWNQEVILVKGARSFEFEKIGAKLQRKVHGTVMEVDLGALVHNFNYFKSCLLPTTKVMVMVKAFAYGSGSNEIANLLQYHQADYLGVAYPDEGVELRKNNISLPIMVMNPSEDSFDQLLQFELEPEIYNFKLLSNLIDYLDGRECKVHIKLDTGMHRLGFSPAEIQPLIETLKLHRNLSIASVFSHLAGADESVHDDYSANQAKLFLHGANLIAHHIGYKPLFHILNSPGILRLSEYQFDMVRLGIGLYGVDPTSNGSVALRPVATLKTIVSHIQSLKQGETVGYGRRGVAERDMKIGTIAIGYADGYTRAFSRGVGKVLVKGQLAPVVGNVCMDMTMIDLTDIDATEGDEVIIFGKDLPIHQVASQISTIPYEILTNTSERVKRVFIAEGI